MKVMAEDNALLESKAVVKDFATNVVNFGSKLSIFAAAEKSQSFRKQIVEYVLVFRTADGRKEFEVGKEVYDRSHEGSRGRLLYYKDRFISFCKDNLVVH